LDPEQVQRLPGIHVNLNFVFTELKRTRKNAVQISFLLNIIYGPSVAQITIKGEAKILSDVEEDIKRIIEKHQTEKSVPPQIISAISEIVIPDIILITRMLNLPPPLPFERLIPTKENENPTYCS